MERTFVVPVTVRIVDRDDDENDTDQLPEAAKAEKALKEAVGRAQHFGLPSDHRAQITCFSIGRAEPLDESLGISEPLYPEPEVLEPA